ncbi:uncharacterized protein VICG_01867 [Vittaforma corneae ATCC 50505]|uniref:Ribosomal protein L22e n=1 Tax=Vittaforma corneae (strain ATCC 50505) TaxID=993615 RepID=L2GKC4_VITCO|nr:uncharacterized protein VICG_01867 [Vittaforma corneae ATCC 50505]ELA41074.1 hypothetical protein VICG_01867 [Vittaforma corneae ATCC 50505]
MEKTEENLRTYTVNFASQVKDGLITPEDVISYLQSKMKVKNCLKIAAREISFKDNASAIDIVSKEGNIKKRNMKLYLKRYLRTKSLSNFIKVSGDNKDGFSFVYINAVDDAEE